MRFTCGGGGGGIRHEAEHRFLDISKIHVGPVELKRLRFMPKNLTSGNHHDVHRISYILYKISDIIYEISYLFLHIRYLICHIRYLIC